MGMRALSVATPFADYQDLGSRYAREDRREAKRTHELNLYSPISPWPHTTERDDTSEDSYIPAESNSFMLISGQTILGIHLVS